MTMYISRCSCIAVRPIRPVAFGRRLAMLLSGQQIGWRGDLIKVTVGMGVALRRTGESLEQLEWPPRWPDWPLPAGRGPGQIESS